VGDPQPSGRGTPGHAGHDPELIVALLDRELADSDRAVAEARVSACPACAALHADLVAVAAANVALATPSRPREFTLTPAMAAGLVRTAGREPVPTRTRLTGEMTASRSTHATHDRLLIANLIDRSPGEADRVRAEEQMAGCPECALLYDDLRALSAATRAMPVPSRRRDFTLTRADAERLRIPRWRRVLAAIGSPRDAFSRPLAIGLTTLGLAGLLVGMIPGATPGMGGAATSQTTVGDAARNAAGGAGPGEAANPEVMNQGSGAPSAPAGSGPAMAATAPSAAPSDAAVPAPAASAEDNAPDVLFEGGESSPIAGEPDGRGAGDLFSKNLKESGSVGISATVIVAAMLLVAGLGLFTMRWLARRLEDD
jgi:anti-sigma factor RsiW